MILRRFVKYLLIFTGLAFSLVLALLLLATSLEYRPGDVEPAQTIHKTPGNREGDSLFSVVTWNLGYFGLGAETDFFYDGGKMTRPGEEYYRYCVGRAMDFLRENDHADAYFFQEVDFNSRRSYHDDQAGLLALELKGFESARAVNYKVPFVPVPLNAPMGKVNSGLVTFTSIAAAEHIRYAFQTAYDWPVRIFMLDRCFLLTRLKLPHGRDLVLINTHNEAFDEGSQRKLQMALLKETMLAEYEKENYVIVGGDWNLNPAGFDVSTINTGDTVMTIQPVIDPGFFPDGWNWTFDRETPSNRAVYEPYRKGHTPVTIIDFFVVSPNVDVVSVKTSDLGFAWSDHHPVKMVIRLPGSPIHE